MRFSSSSGGQRAKSAALLAPAILATAVFLTACGGSTKSGAAATTTTTTPRAGGSASFAAARARFTSCLEAHGVPASEATRGFGGRRGTGSTVTGPSSSTPSTPPTTNAAYAAAFAACRSDLPSGFGGGGGFQNSAAGRAYLQCLQLHGVTIPSTPPSAPGASTPSTRPNFGSLANNPKFQQARAACAALAPSRSGSTTTQPGASS
jgi:hypothetical protein